MKYKDAYEVSLKTIALKIGAVDFLRCLLIKQGFLEEQLVEYEHYPYVSLKIYYTKIKEAQRVFKSLKALKLKNVSLSLKRLTAKSWMKKGEEDFKAFNLTSKLFVIPEKDKKTYANKPNKIILTSGLAFGTGLHETTRFMSGIVDKYAQPQMSFLDIGTGTGILTIAALKGGVKNVLAIDISADAVETARRNVIVNGYPGTKVKKLDFNKFKVTRTFDFVAANLITKDLIPFQDKLKSLVTSGGYLALSGISIENYSFFRKHFKTRGFKCVKIVKGKEWTAVLFRKS